MQVLRELVEQLDGIGVPDWHGAEGLDLDEARACLAKPDATMVPVHRVGIRTEGGVVQSVFSNAPLMVDLINYPDELDDAEQELIHEVEWVDGQGVLCELSQYEAFVLPDEFAKIDVAVAKGPHAEQSDVRP